MIFEPQDINSAVYKYSFVSVRGMTHSTNKSPANVLKNLMVRQSLAIKNRENHATDSYLRDEEKVKKSTVTIASEQLRLDSTPTYLSNNFILQNKVSRTIRSKNKT